MNVKKLGGLFLVLVPFIAIAWAGITLMGLRDMALIAICTIIAVGFIVLGGKLFFE